MFWCSDNDYDDEGGVLAVVSDFTFSTHDFYVHLLHSLTLLYIYTSRFIWTVSRILYIHPKICIVKW